MPSQSTRVARAMVIAPSVVQTELAATLLTRARYRWSTRGGRSPRGSGRRARCTRRARYGERTSARPCELAWREEFVRAYAETVHGRELLARGRIVQRVVEPRDRARGVAKRGMLGDVADPLAVEIDLAAVAKAREVLLAGQELVGAGHFSQPVGESYGTKMPIASTSWICPC